MRERSVMRKVSPLVPQCQNKPGNGRKSGRLESQRCQGHDEATQRGFMKNQRRRRERKKNSMRNRGKSWTGMLR